MTTISLPPWTARASEHAIACWLVDCRRVKDYAEARRAVGRMRKKDRTSVPASVQVSVQEFQGQMERMKLS